VNEGTEQPRVDARVDYDFAGGNGKLMLQAGYGGTAGILHSGIGPFRIDQGAKLSFWQVTWTKKAMKLQGFMNLLDGTATNMVSIDPTGQPIGLTFAPKTFDVEFGDTQVLGTKNALTYGGNLRLNRFELSIAPGENSRTEGGAYIQDEFVANEHFRIIAGGRIDKFTSIENAVFSPRVAFVFKPVTDQSIRISYNRAYRAPSMVNNHLDTVIATPLPLNQVLSGYGNAIYLVPTTAVGNLDLKEESVDSYEVAYTGYVGKRLLVSAAAYYTEYKDGIYFTPTSYWLTAPPGFPGLGPAPPELVWKGVVAKGILFPSQYTYVTLGTVVNKGVELGLDAILNETFTGFINYAFQSDPIPSFPNMSQTDALREINHPSRHQFNAGISVVEPLFGQLSISHASEAYWQDVLTCATRERRSRTSVNTTFGLKFQDGRYGLGEGDEPGQPDDSTAHLRRFDQAAGRRRIQNDVQVKTDRGSPGFGVRGSEFPCQSGVRSSAVRSPESGVQSSEGSCADC
jgi:iron complex outermembrane receptor protein